MTPFEIIVSIGIFSIIICLGLIAWFLRQSIIKPIQTVKQQVKQKIATEVKQAKIQLDIHKVESRIEPKVKTSAVQNDLEKLKDLRRRK